MKTKGRVNASDEYDSAMRNNALGLVVLLIAALVTGDLAATFWRHGQWHMVTVPCLALATLLIALAVTWWRTGVHLRRAAEAAKHNEQAIASWEQTVNALGNAALTKLLKERLERRAGKPS